MTKEEFISSNNISYSIDKRISLYNLRFMKEHFFIRTSTFSFPVHDDTEIENVFIENTEEMEIPFTNWDPIIKEVLNHYQVKAHRHSSKKDSTRMVFQEIIHNLPEITKTLENIASAKNTLLNTVNLEYERLKNSIIFI